MAINNKVELVGHLGKDPRITETKKGELMAAFSIATRDSYLKDEAWHQKEAVWHSVLVFNKDLVSLTKIFTKGTRVKVTGGLTYKDFPYKPRGAKKAIPKKEASIIAHKLEPAPLQKSDEEQAGTVAPANQPK